ncbi:MAG: serine/threonine protein kinase [Coleofasciculaceae cyanobacterium RL_1_1]|nr:serine/threonine protein kinase [Coleofasciculaceae cyanobacterium RL_1_1]
MKTIHNPGDTIDDRYRILHPIGQGGTGTTYAAEELEGGRQVAIKVLSLRQIDDWKLLELFEREAAVLATLKHRSIPQYLSFFSLDTPDDRRFYLVQTLVEGRSLADLVATGWRPEETTVYDIALQVLDVLAYLQERVPPVIHRDIKPENLLRRSDGSIALVDFGAVQDVYRQTIAKGSTFVGTIGYMPPEQFQGRVVPASDLYALGATLVFLLCGQAPDQLPHLRMKLDFRSQVNISDRFATWLETMLEPLIEDRFVNAVQAFEAAIDESHHESGDTSDHNPSLNLHHPLRSPATVEPIGPHLEVHQGPNYLAIEVIPERWTWRSQLMRLLCWVWNGVLGVGVVCGGLLILGAILNEGVIAGFFMGVAMSALLLCLPIILGVWLTKQLRSMRGIPTHLDLDADRLRVRQPHVFGSTFAIDCHLANLTRLDVDLVRLPQGKSSLRLVKYTLVSSAKARSFQVLLSAAEQDWLTQVLTEFVA